MSRVGNKVITVPAGVELKAEGVNFSAKGPLGSLSTVIPASVSYSFEEGALRFSRDGNRPQERADHGLARALVNNLVVGVTQGFSKILELEGTGYKWEVRGRQVVMNMGYSHTITIDLPEGVNCEIKGSVCEVKGIDKQVVGFIAAAIRRVRKVEPYKGKGIRYRGEFVRRKAGKAGAK
ncbi:50S ribosomal protein L6 [bacterium]|nr:50S ribosomal protein L6 [bacterium]